MPSLRLKPHATIKRAVVRDAKKRDLSINQVVVEILSKEFRVRFSGTGRKSNGTWSRNGSSSSQMPVPVPDELHAKIKREARRRERDRQREATNGNLPIYSMNEVAERVLCEHYGLPYIER